MILFDVGILEKYKDLKVCSQAILPNPDSVLCLAMKSWMN